MAGLFSKLRDYNCQHGALLNIRRHSLIVSKASKKHLRRDFYSAGIPCSLKYAHVDLNAVKNGCRLGLALMGLLFLSDPLFRSGVHPGLCQSIRLTCDSCRQCGCCADACISHDSQAVSSYKYPLSWKKRRWLLLWRSRLAHRGESRQGLGYCVEAHPLLVPRPASERVKLTRVEPGNR